MYRKKILKPITTKRDSSIRPPPLQKKLTFHLSQIIFIGIVIAVEQEFTMYDVNIKRTYM